MNKKIISNTLAQILSKAATAIMSIFLISILTNYLTVEMYGLYSKIYNYVGIFIFLADLGLYTITIREINHQPENSEKIVANMLTLRVFLGVLMLFLGIFIAIFIPGYDSGLALSAIFITSFFTIFQLINSSILALMQSKLQMEFSLISTIVGKGVNILLICFIVYIFYQKENISNFDSSFLWIMFAGVFGIIINTLLNYFYARKICPIRFGFDLAYIKHIFKISIPYGIALFLSVVYFKVDIILLSIIEGPEVGDKSIALYALPMKIVEVIMMLGGFYLNSLLPSLTEEFKKNNKAGLEKIIQNAFYVLFSSAMCIFTLGILFRDYLIEIIANQSYLQTGTLYNSSDAFLIVFGVVVFYFISLIFIYVLIATHNQSKLLKINIIVTLFNIAGNIILIPKYSFIGAGITTLMSQVILVILCYYFSNKYITFSIVRNIYFIVIVFIFSLGVYYLGSVLLNNFGFHLYGEFFIYGTLLFGLYLVGGYVYFGIYLKKMKKNIG